MLKSIKCIFFFFLPFNEQKFYETQHSTSVYSHPVSAHKAVAKATFSTSIKTTDHFYGERFWNMHLRIIYIHTSGAAFLLKSQLIQAHDHTTQPLLPFQQEPFTSRDTSPGSLLFVTFFSAVSSKARHNWQLVYHVPIYTHIHCVIIGVLRWYGLICHPYGPSAIRILS